MIFAGNIFGQNQRKKHNFYNLPEVDDEVLVAFRKKQPKPKVSKNNSIKKGFRRLTHDSEFEWRSNRQNKSRKSRR